MKALAKSTINECEEHAAKVRTALEGLEKAIEDYNGIMAAAQEKVSEAAAKLQEAIGDANEWREALNVEQEDYYGEKSERWQDSDAGQSYSAWKDEWAIEWSFDDIEFPPELEMPDCDVADVLDNIPTAPQ